MSYAFASPLPVCPSLRLSTRVNTSLSHCQPHFRRPRAGPVPPARRNRIPRRRASAPRAAHPSPPHADATPVPPSSPGASTPCAQSLHAARLPRSPPLPPPSSARHALKQRLRAVVAAVALALLPPLANAHPATAAVPVTRVRDAPLAAAAPRQRRAPQTRARQSSLHAHIPVAVRRSPHRPRKAHGAIATVVSPVRCILPMGGDPLGHKLAKSALLLGLVGLVVITTILSVMFACQDAIVYKPTKTWRGNPAESGMPHYEDVSYTTRDGVHISGWFIRQPPDSFESARTLIYFHGRDKNASFRLGKVVGLYDTCKCNILLISYRGFGLSTGKPNERGMSIDAESAYDYLKSRGDVDVGPGGNLWVYGESLGGAVAIYFSQLYQHCINALILENTFTSLLDMAKLEFPMLGVFRYLSKNRWQSKKRIGDLGIPLLFLSGLKDAYIPPCMMKQMHTLATKSPLKEFVEFKNGTHNRTWTMAGFYESVATFMDRVDHEVSDRGTPLKTAPPTATASADSPGGSDDFGRVVAAS